MVKIIPARYKEQLYQIQHHPSPSDQVKVYRPSDFRLIGWLPMRLVKGQTVTQIMKTIQRNRIAASRLRRAVSGSKFELFYIGNLESWGDDRGWYVGIKGTKLHQYLGSTWDLPQAYENWSSIMDTLKDKELQSELLSYEAQLS
jgi:hypothetical protein